MARKGRYRGISRIDSKVKNMHGWFARVYLDGKVYASKYFNDNKYDGRRNGLRAAMEWRRETEAERNRKFPHAKHPRRRVTRDRRNKTGIIGISRTHSRNRSGTYTISYQVTWRPRPNVVKSRSFSVKKYGEVGALWRAWKVRQKVEMKMYGKIQTPDFERFRQNILDKLEKQEKLPDLTKLFSS
jgi:hypothetical protein